MMFVCIDWLIVLGFNDMPTIVGHFVSSPREDKRDRRDTRGDERDREERKMNDSEDSKETKTFPLCLYLLQR